MKSFLPWLVALVCIGAAGFFYTANQKLVTEVAALRVENSKAEPLRAELEQLKQNGSPAQAEEIARLQKKTEELLKLRNQVRQLSDSGKELEKVAQAAQVREQAAQAQAQAAASQAEAAVAQAQAAQQQIQVVRSASQNLTARQALGPCINNLRQLDGAKQQWALENRKTEKDTPTEQDIAPYLKGGALPTCPAGGRYTLYAVSSLPTCTILEHALPQQ